MSFDDYGYGPVAAVYDELATFYSLGRIGQTKRDSVEFVSAGDRVLFPGVGRGTEAIAAARLGAVVTGVDISASMLRRLREKLDAEGLEAELVEGDMSAHRPLVAYDVVVANYFLNLYDVARAKEMISMIGHLLRPGGRMVISDFARPSGGSLGRFLAGFYYRPINGIAWLLGLCAMHPILDYAELLDTRMFRVVSECRYPVFGLADPAYTSIMIERIAG